MREENIPHALIKLHAQEFIDIGAPFNEEVAMFQTHTVTPSCVCKPAAPRPAPAPAAAPTLVPRLAPTLAPKYSAELMRMFAQLVMLR
ncbi:hypothetical protein [Duganella vulcania]|uniref:Uncharacterized protein n=1 Tax=Duganella vulcania TaxID=2692166 RepID=A0A845GT97_9BURK|nr:hypothetical protein [Duganella vulcania]MYM96935.1 hypothetical protein [Duganella vulcania]